MKTYPCIVLRLATLPLAFLPRVVATATLDRLATWAFGPAAEPYESRTGTR